MPSEVLGRGTDRDCGLVDFEANLRPLGNRVKTDASLDQDLRQIFTLRLERVSSDGHRSGRLLCFNELEALARCKEIEEELKQVVIVIEGLANIMLELLHIIGTRLSSLTELLKVSQDFDRLFDPHLNDSKVLL